jgi:hypothetical protein
MIPPAAAHHCPRPLATGYGPGPEPEPEPRVSPEPRASPGARGSFFFGSSIAALFPLRFPRSQSGRGAGGGGPPLAARPIRNAKRDTRNPPSAQNRGGDCGSDKRQRHYRHRHSVPLRDYFAVPFLGLAHRPSVIVIATTRLLDRLCSLFSVVCCLKTPSGQQQREASKATCLDSREGALALYPPLRTCLLLLLP